MWEIFRGNLDGMGETHYNHTKSRREERGRGSGMDLRFLQETSLFQGLTEQEIQAILPCLGARETPFGKGETLCRAGELAQGMGVVLEGSVHIVAHHYWGGSHIFGHVGPGELFGETYALLPEQELLVDVVAAEPGCALFLRGPGLGQTCAQACPFHSRMLRNLLQILAGKNLQLSTRMMHTASRTIRDRLCSYLSEQAVQQGSHSFTLPFTRQQLADYLGVDRSALSHELSKMQRDGLLTFRKNRFTLTGPMEDS